MAFLDCNWRVRSCAGFDLFVLIRGSCVATLLVLVGICVCLVGCCSSWFGLCSDLRFLA